MGCVCDFVHTLGQWSTILLDQIPCKDIYNVLTTYKLVQLFILYSTAIIRQSLDLSAISLLGRDEGTCKILSYIQWN